MRVAVIDYGVGNLASVSQGLKMAGMDPLVTLDKEEILEAGAVILPGVGAFARGMDNLRDSGLIPVLHEIAARNTPLLGICLGMQLLFEKSEEHGEHTGLGLLKGRVRRFPAGLKIPHMGWNMLTGTKNHLLLRNIPARSYVYFVHSYYVEGANLEHIAACTNYGVEFPAIVCFNNIVGMQFHPEKSSRVGLEILKNFGGLVRDVSNPSH